MGGILLCGCLVLNWMLLKRETGSGERGTWSRKRGKGSGNGEQGVGEGKRGAGNGTGN